MRFDTIIIGGGLAGLVCGLSLQRRGQKCAIVSEGQNAMHFSSGYFSLLDRTPGGEDVDVPSEAACRLPESHPYSKVGKENFLRYQGMVKDFFASAGVVLSGNAERNSFRITPTGEVRTAWLCMDDFTAFPTREARIGDRVMVVNIPGFLDFNVQFVAAGIEKRGASCRIVDVSTAELEHLRTNPSEMRSTNIARMMENRGAAEKFALAVRSRIDDEDAVVLPAVFGLKSTAARQAVSGTIGIRTEFVATMPPSVPGIRTQLLLKREFERCGGTFLMGDRVLCPEMDGRRVVCVKTSNFGESSLYADNFVLGSGSFFSKGLVSSRDKVAEPVFGLDVDAAGGSPADENFFREQKYISFGVVTDREFHAVKGGEVIENLYAAGSVLGGYNPLVEGSGAGTAIMSAMSVAERITGE